jgi:hypothetical protein
VNDVPDPEWKLTTLSRALVDFDILLTSQVHGPFFRSIETITGLFEEQKRLTARINTLYLATFAAACAVLSGPLPNGAKVSVLGIEAPVSIVPQQVIAVVMAVAYGMFASLFASLIILTQMISKILMKEGSEAWQFFSGRFDASGLWGVLILPRYIGYQSPKRHLALGLAILMVAVLSVSAHALVITVATVFALFSAWENGAWYLIAFAAAAAAICMTSIFSLVAMIGLRLPFRLGSPDKLKGESTS